ncbi:hypothetical protein ABMA28_006306 [Loxostege sticticalis]|uniref:Peptidase M14 carboxypeptidase A domain-containing protein n=1 Tax=Loxostege sticticalis TaxID=481309 RepID=A0ABD0SKT0_LOXSC
MIEMLKEGDEAECIEDASIGASTITIYLKAIKRFCGNITEIIHEKTTFEGRHLYEVHLYEPKENDDRPMIVVEAGQEAGTESVGLALYLLEQLLACQENHEMLLKVRWVILPCTNPDGMEFSRFNRQQWRKNLNPDINVGNTINLGYGVDISRNFEDKEHCPQESGFSPTYSGPKSFSENESSFIQSVLSKFKKEIKGYLSIRRDGHSISYPYGYTAASAPAKDQLERVSGAIASRVNQRAGGVHLFSNQSIFVLNRKARCGHSVDYAYKHMSITYSFEMRVFLGSDSRIMSKFQNLPRGYEATLRNGYYSGIREFYNIIVKESVR